MRTHVLEREQRIARPLSEVFEFFAQPGNLERITPPWLSFRLVDEARPELREGSLIRYRLRVHGVPITWVSRIELWEPGRTFVDRQLRGPYRFWRHRHEFAADGAGTVIRDRVEYALPLGPLGGVAHVLLVRRDIERIFDFRQQATSRLLG